MPTKATEDETLKVYRRGTKRSKTIDLYPFRYYGGMEMMKTEKLYSIKLEQEACDE